MRARGERNDNILIVFFLRMDACPGKSITDTR